MIDAVIEQAIRTPGAISVAELLAIRWLIQTHYPATPSAAFDFGGCAGKAATAQLAGLVGTKCEQFDLVEPSYGPPRPDLELSVISEPWRSNVTERLQAIAPAIPVRIHPVKSLEFLDTFQGRVGCVFLDSGNHTEPLLTVECNRVEQIAVPGALFIFHDFGNQFCAPQEKHAELLATGRFEVLDIDWGRFNEAAGNLETENDSWHRYPNLKNPNFVGAVRLKR